MKAIIPLVVILMLVSSNSTFAQTSGNFVDTDEAFQTKTRQVAVYPNPTDENVIVTGEKGSRLIVSNVIGNVLLNKKIENDIEVISLKEFSNGIYIFTINSKSCTRVQKK